MFKCKCRTCGIEYESKNHNDTDGEGNCASCFEEKKRIAKIIDDKFKGKVFSQPKILDIDKIPRIPGTNYINARDIL